MKTLFRRFSLLVLAGLLGLASASCDGDGDGGDGSCPNGQTIVTPPIPTDVPCDLTGTFTQCADACDSECAANDFELGEVGSACAKETDDAAYCRCLCAYCGAR